MITPTPSPRRGRPVDERARAERRARILAAARRRFLASGFHAASTADISREAGVSVANLYQYFPSKEDLVLAMVEDDLQSDLAFFADLFEGAGFLARVEAALAALVAEGRERGALGLRAEIFAEALRNERVRVALARSEARLIAALEAVVRAAADRGEIVLRDGLAARDVAGLLFVLADGVYAASGLDLLDAASAPAAAHAMLRRALIP